MEKDKNSPAFVEGTKTSGESLTEKTGLPPGVLVYIGHHPKEKGLITVMDYNEEQMEEYIANTPQECFPLKDSETVSWINLDGVQDIKLTEALGMHFGLDNLVLEDILNMEQRPKVEFFHDHVFFSLKMMSYDKPNNHVVSEQVSFVLGKNYVVSFQERHGDVFEPVRSRLRNKWGSIRYNGSDYLAYALVDVIVDHYFEILEKISKDIDEIEEEVMQNPKEALMRRLQLNKRHIKRLQHSIHPLRDAILRIQRNETKLISDNTLKYFKDVRDHTFQVIDNIDSCQDLNASVQQIYHSSLSHKMNQVMKMLTIISTLFIPLTFIVGVYGMNFHYMPELSSRYGYWVIWLLVLTLTCIQLYFFKRKKWI